MARLMNLSFLLTLVFFICADASHAKILAKDSEGMQIELVTAEPNADLTQDRKFYVLSWMSTYQDFPPELFEQEFGTKEMLAHSLNKSFDEEEMLLRTGKIYYVQAFSGGEWVGLATFEKDNVEEDAVYVRKLVVKPGYRLRGVGTHLLFSIKTDPTLLPKTKTLFIITRILNEKAMSYYEKLGFRKRAPMRDEYDPAKFVGWEWRKP